MTFPTIHNIADVLPFVEGRPEFAVRQRDGYTSIDYIYTDKDTFDCPVRRECRGLKFDAETGNLIARPFHKFFNLGERPDATPDFSGEHCVMEKLDGCLQADTPIRFVDGTIHTIQEIVRNKLSGPIWGYDEETKQVVPSEITGWSEKLDDREWLEITATDGQLSRRVIATPNHRFLTEDGWVRAEHIKQGNAVYKLSEAFSFLQKSAVLGGLLGDASKTKQATTPVLQWSNKRKEYNDFRAALLSPFHTHNYRVTGGYGGERWICTTRSASALRAIATETYADKKAVSTRWLSVLNEVSLAFWYMDDGSLSQGQANQRPRALLHTEGFREDEVDIIVSYFESRWGLKPVKQRYRRGEKVYVALRFNADCADKFWRIVAPFCHPCFDYKFPDSMRPVGEFWKTLPKLSNSIKQAVEWRVSSVRAYTPKHGNKRSKFDIQTNTTNFFANGILVHNSMIHPASVNGELVFMTRAGVTEQAKMAQYCLEKLPYGYTIRLFCEDMIRLGKTPVFEFTSPQNRIVIPYGEDSLTLLAVRDNASGAYLPHEALLNTCINIENHGAVSFPMVRVFDLSASDLNSFSAHTRSLSDMEGYIVRVGQQFVKVKADAYVASHRAKSGLLWEKDVLRLALEAKVDDVAALLSDDEATRLRDWTTTVLAHIGAEARRYIFIMSGLGQYKDDRKAFAESAREVAQAGFNPSFLFSMLDGREAYEVIADFGLKQTSSGTKARAFLASLGVPEWQALPSVAQLES